SVLAAAENGGERGARKPVSRELERPRPPERPCLDIRESGERLDRIEAPGEEILDELIETRDRVEVDDRRTDTKRVAALMGNRAERDLDDRWRRGDLGPDEPQ